MYGTVTRIRMSLISHFCCLDEAFSKGFEENDVRNYDKNLGVLWFLVVFLCLTCFFEQGVYVR